MAPKIDQTPKIDHEEPSILWAYPIGAVVGLAAWKAFELVEAFGSWLGPQVCQ